MNAFRCTPDRSLDREYLRVCAVYRLLKSGRISKSQAIEISQRRIRGCHRKQDGWLKATIELWLNGPLRHARTTA
jgi:hypothetical protein